MLSMDATIYSILYNTAADCDLPVLSTLGVLLVSIMTLTAASDNTLSIFKDGKLTPGIYKIQNIETENYVDIEVHSRQLCCRPARDLGEGRGLVSRYPSFVVRV